MSWVKQCEQGISEASIRAEQPRAVLSRLGWLLGTGGVIMAAMPFGGPFVGLPFDGAETWLLDGNRLVLHVLPGCVAILLAALLVRAARIADPIVRGATVRRSVPALVVLAAWAGSGPWLWDALLPASQNGKMFESIEGFEEFSVLHQLWLEAACHWIPGYIFLLVAVSVFVAARRRESLR